MNEIKLNEIIKNLTDIQKSIDSNLFKIDDVTKNIIQCINEFRGKIKTKTNPDLTTFDESITNFYTNPSSSEKTYNQSYDDWIKGNTDSCNLDGYFKDLNPDTYTDVVTEFNSLYNAVKKTGDTTAAYSGYQVFIIIIMCIDNSRWVINCC